MGSRSGTEGPLFATTVEQQQQRVGLSGFGVATITIERMASQVRNISQGRLPEMTVGRRWGMYRATIGKQTALMFLQCTGTRELRLAFDQVLPYPALSVMLAAGLSGVPGSSIQYNWIIRDTYRYFKFEVPVSSVWDAVLPGIFWAFVRAGVCTGGGLYAGPFVSAALNEKFVTAGVEPNATITTLAGGLISGATGSLVTQWAHNITLVAGRMAALGANTEAPHYTISAARASWREMGVSLLYLNFPQRTLINAVTVSMLNFFDIFHRPELSRWG